MVPRNRGGSDSESTDTGKDRQGRRKSVLLRGGFIFNRNLGQQELPPVDPRSAAGR